MVLNRRLLLFLALCVALWAGFPRNARSEADYAGYIRLHVVASDDSDEAQALKLEVRDACLACARELLRDCGGADEAWALLNDNVPALERAAMSTLKAVGCGDKARCELGVFDFPDRRYGDVLVPAGQYRALRVVIGQGEGHNWWCVLYPSLCCPEDMPEDEPVRFHSVIWDWLMGLFGGDGE